MTLNRPFILMTMIVLIALLASLYILLDHEEEIYDSNAKEFSDINREVIKITRDHTHIRSGPSTDYKIVSFAKKDSSYSVVSESSDWYEIDLGGKTGFIRKDFIHSFNVSLSPAADILKNKLIILDAGHGGHDAGAIGANGTFEKDLAYKTTNMLNEILTTLDANVRLTRNDDQYIRLGSRTSFANMHDADVFISIHYNSFPQQEEITGIGTYYYDDRSQLLAQCIQNALIAETNAENRGIDFGNFQVLRQSVKPAILVELGFISNIAQENLLLTNEYQEMLVRGMVKGLITFFHVQEQKRKRLAHPRQA